MKTIDEFIDFYFGKDLQAFDRITMRAMMTSFGKNCFYAGRTGTFNVSSDAYSSIIFNYPDFNEYINETNENN